MKCQDSECQSAIRNKSVKKKEEKKSFKLLLMKSGLWNRNISATIKGRWNDRKKWNAHGCKTKCADEKKEIKWTQLKRWLCKALNTHCKQCTLDLSGCVHLGNFQSFFINLMLWLFCRPDGLGTASRTRVVCRSGGAVFVVVWHALRNKINACFGLLCFY